MKKKPRGRPRTGRKGRAMTFYLPNDVVDALHRPWTHNKSQVMSAAFRKYLKDHEEV